jgi:predicted CoA-binding protein
MVAAYLIDAGYTVVPVNPGQSEILGQTCYPDLHDIPVPVDVVNIFRRSEDVLPFVEAAVEIGAGTVWMQQGIVNTDGADLAQQHGLEVVMDRCIKVDHQELLG